MQTYIKSLWGFIISNPWTVLTSIGANLFILIKVTINHFTIKKIGRAKLASKRYKELLIPITQVLNNIRIETCVAYHGRRRILLKKFLCEILKFIVFKSNLAEVRKKWTRLKNPMISKPSREMIWDEPDFEKLDKILNEKRSLINKELIGYWYRLKEAYFEQYDYSDEDRAERMIDFILYTSELTDSTLDFLEKKYPNLLME